MKKLDSQMVEAVDIVVVGAGPGGICVGKMLLDAGFSDFVILEKAPGVGGVWWHNAYPGAACDLPSDLYSFSFALKPDWSRPYAPQVEIQKYLEECVDRFGLSQHIRCNQEAVSLMWDNIEGQWTIRLAGGRTLTARIVISAVGMFNVPHTPQIPGSDSFMGTQFHAARWKQGYELKGRRVAIVGSAAAAVQIVPTIAPVVERMYVFQRTPNWLVPRHDTPYSEEALQQRRIDPLLGQQSRLKVYRDVTSLSELKPDFCQRAEQAALRNLESVEDPDLRAKLTPDFPFGCKRPLIMSEYYPTFNRSNVKLVTDGITGILPSGITTSDGQTCEVDTIVYATGFEATKFASVLDITGAKGQTLNDKWSGGPQAYLGITTAGFPNFFMIYGPNTNNGSVIHMIESQAAYVVRHLQQMEAGKIKTMSIKPIAEQNYNTQLETELKRFPVWNSGVNSYYRVGERVVTQCPYTMAEYRELTTFPDLEAYDLEYLDRSTASSGTNHEWISESEAR